MQLLKQSTQVKIPVGVIVDASDGFTPETTLDISTADQAELMKHDGSSTTDISSNTFAHLQDGIYNLTLTSTDTNTLGLLSVLIVDTSLCRPYRQDYMVVPANEYDSLIAGTDALDVNVAEISEDSTAADNLEGTLESVVLGTVQAGSDTDSVVTNLTEATNDHYIGRTIVFRTGDLAGQAAEITDYDGTTKTLTTSTLTEAPGTGDKFAIV